MQIYNFKEFTALYPLHDHDLLFFKNHVLVCPCFLGICKCFGIVCYLLNRSWLELRSVELYFIINYMGPKNNQSLSFGGRFALCAWIVSCYSFCDPGVESLHNFAGIKVPAIYMFVALGCRVFLISLVGASNILKRLLRSESIGLFQVESLLAKYYFWLTSFYKVLLILEFSFSV